MGGGDMAEGRRAVIASLQMPVLDEVSKAPWAVQRLVLMGSPDDEALSAQIGLSGETIATFKDERAAFSQDKTPSFLDEMTDVVLQQAASYLVRLGYSAADLRSHVKSLRTRKACEDSWEDLVAIVPNEFPESALPKDYWNLGEQLPHVFKAKLYDHGREDLAQWVDRTMARTCGLAVLMQITAHLMNLARKQVEGDTGP